MAQHFLYQIGRPALKGKEDSGQDDPLFLYSSTCSCTTASQAAEKLKALSF
jgi:hypothetical protein